MTAVVEKAERPAAVSCVTCGYALDGLAEESVCPECATPIEQSIPGAQSPYPSQQHLRATLFALGCGRVGILALLVSALSLVLLDSAVHVASTWLVRATFELGFLLLMLNAWIMGARTPTPVIGWVDRLSCRLLKACAVLGVALRVVDVLLTAVAANFIWTNALWLIEGVAVWWGIFFLPGAALALMWHRLSRHRINTTPWKRFAVIRVAISTTFVIVLAALAGIGTWSSILTTPVAGLEVAMMALFFLALAIGVLNLFGFWRLQHRARRAMLEALRATAQPPTISNPLAPREVP
ncbi:MAG: hypothetical protein IBJ10_07380 [Phycisphaerales bacterium]|nr:hypothetical protein [Phycisphaerales bacterium]